MQSAVAGWTHPHICTPGYWLHLRLDMGSLELIREELVGLHQALHLSLEALSSVRVRLALLLQHRCCSTLTGLCLHSTLLIGRDTCQYAAAKRAETYASELLPVLWMSAKQHMLLDLCMPAE